jgi:hypothetical protein
MTEICEKRRDAAHNNRRFIHSCQMSSEFNSVLPASQLKKFGPEGYCTDTATARTTENKTRIQYIAALSLHSTSTVGAAVPNTGPRSFQTPVICFSHFCVGTIIIDVVLGIPSKLLAGDWNKIA